MSHEDAYSEMVASFPDGIQFDATNSGGEKCGIYTDSAGGRWTVIVSDDNGTEYFAAKQPAATA